MNYFFKVYTYIIIKNKKNSLSSNYIKFGLHFRPFLTLTNKIRLVNLTELHLSEVSSVWTEAALRETAEMPSAAQHSGSWHSKRRLRGRVGCVHDGASAAEVEVGWSGGVHRAYPESRVSSRNASRTPEASPPDCSDRKPPDRSHRAQDNDQRWTYL